jgi:hypothetical protein
MNTTPHPGDDPAIGSAPHPTELSDDIEALADLDPADAVEPAEELAKQLAAELDAEAGSSPSTAERGELF